MTGAVTSASRHLDLVRVKGKQPLDRLHVVLRSLIAPDSVVDLFADRKIESIALEGAMGLVLAAYEPVHLHVLARKVVDHRVAAFFQRDRIARVGDDLALQRNLDPRARGLCRDRHGRLRDAGFRPRGDRPGRAAYRNIAPAAPRACSPPRRRGRSRAARTSGRPWGRWRA